MNNYIKKEKEYKRMDEEERKKEIEELEKKIRILRREIKRLERLKDNKDLIQKKMSNLNCFTNNSERKRNRSDRDG